MFRGLLFSCLLALATGGAAAVRSETVGPILHEPIPDDPREDMAMLATTSEGELPAGLLTSSGLVPAPDTSRSPNATDKAYAMTQSRAEESSYRADRDTRCPTVLSYDDPFTPTVTPYKRLRAYDSVREDFSLAVAEEKLIPVPSGGTVQVGEDSFYGDLTVELVAGQAVRIPTVGPGARIVSAVFQPNVSAQLVRDGADNWFVRGDQSVRARLVFVVAAPREVFGGFTADPWAVPQRSLVPSNVLPSVRTVSNVIGVNSRGSVKQTVERMVSYFRSFEPSNLPPTGHENLYLDLALERKGVCRHRSYAFVVTALGLGIPSRMVVNEAHAWVEVYDGSLWRRIDLGGAASELRDETTGPERPAHVLPPDPFPWPNQSEQTSGRSLADQARAQRGQDPSPTSSTAGQFSNLTPAPVPAVDASSLPAPARVTLASYDLKTLRGNPLHVQGRVETSRGQCSNVRLNVLLVNTVERREVIVGSLFTDSTGEFEGAVVIPLDVPVGEYDLVVATPGGAGCGEGDSRER